MQAMNAIYEVMKANSAATGVKYPDTFRQYFYETLSCKQYDAAPGTTGFAEGIITSGSFPSSDFPLDGSVTLPALTDCFNTGITGHDGCFFTQGRSYRIGVDKDDKRVSNSKYVKHAVVNGDLFDLNAATLKVSAPLIYGAVYAHSSSKFQVDECWIFAKPAELANTENWSTVKTTDNEKYDSGTFTHTNVVTASFWGIVTTD